MKIVSEEVKKEILARRLAGEKAADLAKEYGVGKSTVCKWYEIYRTTNIDILKNEFSKVMIIESELLQFNLNGYSFEIKKTNLKDFCKSTSIKNQLKLDVTIFKKNQQVNQNLILAATLKKRKNNKGQMTNIIIF